VVEVKDGYGRNYLLPRGFAVLWTKGGEKQIVSIRKARAKRERATLDDAKAVRATLEAKVVTLSARAGATGRLFGAITSGDIADAVVAAGGPQIDRRKVELPQPIKAVGDYSAKVRLHADVQATVKLKVVASR